jgi:zinc protease
MDIHRRSRIVLPLVVVATALGIALAPRVVATVVAQQEALSDSIPHDPQTTVGTLPNGLRYYIRRNLQPRNRAELRLAVNAGSLLEDDDQRGVAHFVEHMLFNGTAHFPGSGIGAFLQSMGVRSGAHVNAQTSFDETVYQLQIPTESPAVIDRTLLILEDWAHNASFDELEIDKERGVVLEEWRQNLGVGARLQAALFPVMLAGSRYVERMPIGTPEIIQRVNHDRLKQFYSDWYRPDLMSVAIVGDINPAEIEALVKAHFAPIPAATTPKPRPAFAVPPHADTKVAIFADREATGTTINIYAKNPAPDQTTIGSYREQIVDRLFSNLLTARLGEIAQQPDAPFLAAQSRKSLFIRTAEVASLVAAVKENGIERGLSTLFSELARIARFGFTPTELDRQRLNTMRALERAAADRDTQVSGSLADEYVRNFTTDEPFPGIVYENELYRRFLPEITLDEINSRAAPLLADADRVVAITAMQRPGLVLPTEARVVALIKAATADVSTAYVDTVSARPLLASLPTPGRVVKATPTPVAGVIEWQLSNGVRVVLMPSTFRQDEILFRAFSPGGLSLARDRDVVPALTATMLTSASGLGSHTASDLRKALAGKTASVRADIGPMDETLAGNASKADLETMFQLIYLTFTEPRVDAQAFTVLKDQLKARLSTRTALPETAFRDALDQALTQNHPRARGLTLESLEQMNAAKSLEFYKDRFGDAGDFTFVFVGTFDRPTIEPLIERYLASLPARPRHESWRDLDIRPPKGVVEKRIEKGIEPKAEVAIVFTGPFEYDPLHRVAIRSMAEMLGGQLSAVLREQLGGTYGVRVETTTERIPTGSYKISIIFSCDPARADALVSTAFAQIDTFAINGPPPQQVADGRATLLRDLETNSRDNRYFLRTLTAAYTNGDDVGVAFDMRALYDKLTPSLLTEAARRYLDRDRYVKVILFPEKR